MTGLLEEPFKIRRDPAKEKPPGEGLKSQGAVPRLPELSREHKLEGKAGFAADTLTVGDPVTKNGIVRFRAANASSALLTYKPLMNTI